MGGVLKHHGNASRVQLPIEVLAVSRPHYDMVDARGFSTEQVFIRLVAPQKIVCFHSETDRISKTVRMQNETGRRTAERGVACTDEEQQRRTHRVDQAGQSSKRRLFSPK